MEIRKAGNGSVEAKPLTADRQVWSGRSAVRGLRPTLDAGSGNGAFGEHKTTTRRELMASVTLGYGAALTALGVGGYFGTGKQSKTALIPAAFGVMRALLRGKRY